MPLKYDPITTLKEFKEFGDKAKNHTLLHNFVEEHFEPPGNELIATYPEDWVPIPPSFHKIQDPNLRRRVKDDVREHQQKYSLLYVPHPFIIPGGRFREFYYW
uniref:Trehalase n=1 Tax=Acrobeloides nanus TaxID=290746 RepID=A0A914DU04_9BILA